MSLNNIIYLGRDNEVFISFTFGGDFSTGGLTNFTDISLSIGVEVYTLLTTPTQLFLKDDFTLALKIGDITALTAGSYGIDVIGFSAVYGDGFVLNCASHSAIERVIVKDC